MNYKKDFPIFKRKIKGNSIIYLDNAATSQKPISVIKAITDYYSNNNANISRGVHTLAQESTEKYELARSKIAEFINCKSKELIFTKNATEAINIVANSIKSILKPGDEIVTSIMEHHSNLIPWYQLKKQGIKVKIIDITEDYKLDFTEEIITENTKLITLSHVSNVLGTINPIKEIIKLAKKRGILTLIDGAQAVPHIQVDMKDIGCDFYVFSGHKMLGPMGIGCLYCESEKLSLLQPLAPGGGNISGISDEVIDWVEPPIKLEGGTPNVAGAIGLMEAINYINTISMSKIESDQKKLLKYALERLSHIKGIQIINPDDQCGLISFNIKGYTCHEICAFLDSKNIALRSGHHCAIPLMKRLNVEGTCRLSIQIYNDTQDIDALIKTLEELE